MSHLFELLALKECERVKGRIKGENNTYLGTKIIHGK